jgi:hypothetical protein
MRLANMAFAEMTEALNRGWENRDSRWRDRKARPSLAAHAAPFLWLLPGRCRTISATAIPSTRPTTHVLRGIGSRGVEVGNKSIPSRR